jgi:hypothetical protein
MVTIELSGRARLRPQETDRPLSARRTVFFDDEPLNVTAIARFATMDERGSFVSSFPVLVLQRRDSALGRWRDISTFYSNIPAPIRPPGPTRPPAPGSVTPTPQIDPRAQPAIPPSPMLPHEPIQPGGSIPFPEDPGHIHHSIPGAGPPFHTPATTVPSLAFDSARLTLSTGVDAIRASARRADGSSVDSSPLLLEVRPAPAVLTLLAMGGTCTDPDANTHYQTLSDAGITRDTDKCAARNVNPTWLADLTPMASVNCNDPCNAGCTNFLEHLALRIMNTGSLANEFDSINNPGTDLCAHRENPAGIRNRVVFGKWRNTEEEPVCSTPVKFNTIIDDFVSQGGKSLILIGQSQGGAKFAGMVRDHWRWGDDLTLELIAMWDATSFDVVSFSGHLGIESMGVRKVGSHPKRVLSFFQYSNLVPFQNGAPLDPAEQHDSAEQHDLDGCFTHNGIARSQFVHQRTAEVVKETLQAVRDRARQ